MAEAPAPPVHEPASGRTLLALVVGQVGMHSAMAGLRLAAPLQALREGFSAGAVGLLLALFAAAPVVLALHAGRMADRHGYHHPVRISVWLCIAGALCAVGATFVAGAVHVVLLCAAAMLSGAGANMGMLAIQRTAGLAARDATDRVRIFSWLGMAPSLSNVVGPVSAGLLIDLGGFRLAYAFMLLLPVATLVASRYVPVRPPPAANSEPAKTSAWTLLREPGMKRLLFVNWLLSTCWDVHTFAVPIIGHEHGFSASTIGLILGTFTMSVTLIRMAIPAIAHRLSGVELVRAAMIGTGIVFVLYPFASSPWLMAACAVALGITLGSTQPVIMATLHHLTPAHRHGEALAFRSMAINASSTAMPLVFGVAGVAVGAAALFWLIGGIVGAGSWAARDLEKPRT